MTASRSKTCGAALLLALLALLGTGCASDTASGDPAATRTPADRGADALLRLPRADASGAGAGAGAWNGRGSGDHAPESAPRPPQPDAAAPAAASPRFAWRCEDGGRPETRWDPDSGDLLMRLDDERLLLRSVRVASGAAWEGGPDGALRFWNRGDEAVLTATGRETLCRVDPVTTADLRAAAEGARFRALGNEPGWQLVIRPDRIDWVTDYGATRDSFGNPEMRESGVLEIWEAGTGARRLRVEIGPGPCLDASERSFPATVAVLEGDRRLPGCGSRLEHLPD